ncbi:MAG: type II toxin-antitoxin system HicA family toxin [Bacteroidetes bacterium]|nr:type II toxin-antitoxin system HicA family toxin [Bacteroidota bacterium]MCL6101694.1 type II toxin-antitoxin system HicA family toxin [Bacteroidota bacterium]
MKRGELIKYLTKNNCELLREGAKHSIYFNRINKRQTTVPRHPDVSDLLCKIICKQLQIPSIK